MGSIPTIRVKLLYGKGGEGNINADDFDSKKHKKISDNEPQQAEPEGGFTKVERSPGWFDVVDSKGEKQNDNALRESAADKLVTKLNG